MRYPVILAGSLLAGAISAMPAAAQTAPTLAYVQPLPPQAVQQVQDRLAPPHGLIVERHVGKAQRILRAVWLRTQHRGGECTRQHNATESRN